MLSVLLMNCVPALGSITEVEANGVRAQASLQDGAQVIYDEADDGALYAVGRDWKARFAPDGASFIPFLGSDAPHNEIVRFQLGDARVDGNELDVHAGVGAARAGDTIRFERGALEERYEARPEGLEHVLVFRELPVRGEIVVRCAVDTDLAARETDDAVEFTNERGGVRYSGAIAFDGAGRRCALRSRWDGEAIVLTIPAEMTRAAVLPLTIDPLVQVFGLATTPTYELAPDASIGSGPGSLHRCEVWETAWSQTDHDVTARVTKLSDGSVTVHAIDATFEYWSRPKVAWIWDNKLQSEFQIVAAVGLPSSGAREIRGRVLGIHFVQPPVLSGVATIGAGGGGDHHSPDVGGDPYTGGSSSGSSFLVIWERDDVNGDSDIRAAQVVGGTAFNVPAFAADPVFDDESPRLSKSDGILTWCVVWNRRLSATNGDIWSRTVSWDFASITAPMAISTSPEDDRHPTVSSLGTAGFVIAYERDLGGQNDVMVQVLSGATLGSLVDLTLLEGGTHAALDQVLPVVDGDGYGYLLTYKESDPVVANLLRTRLTGFLLTPMAQVVTTEVHTPLGSPTTNRTRANVCSESASTGTNVLRFEVVWDEAAQSTSSDVFAAIWSPGISSGIVVAGCFGDGNDTPCPCGNNGGAPAGCPSSVQAHGAELLWTGEARLTPDTFVVHATRLPPSGVGLLAQGTTLLSPANVYGDGLLCLGGMQTRIALRMANANGEITYPASGSDPTISAAGSVPGIGGTRVYQIVYRNLASFCTPATWNTTNALQVNWIP